MKNIELARIFYEMADILEMQNIPWKPRAFRTVAKALETMEAPVEEFYKKNALREIPGVGERIEEKIIEFLKTGKIKEHEKLVKTVPKHIYFLMQVPGMGPKKAQKLYSRLKISSVKQLEEACKKHLVSKIAGFGEKSEHELLENIQMLRKGFGERIPLRRAEAIGNKVIARLKGVKYIINISLAGSLRRRKSTIRDIDVIAATKQPAKVIDAFTKMPEVEKVLAKGSTKATVVLKSGMQADIRVFPLEQWGSGLLYLTGSKTFNIEMRKAAIRKGYKLNEYGLFEGSKRIAGRTEEEVFKKLGMKFVPPEKREA